LQTATGASSSGIDVTAAVQAAVYAAQAPERQWQAQQATITSQITALTSIQTALTSLKTDMNNLGDLSGALASRTVTSSSSAVSGTSTAGAAIGQHTIAVQGLASKASWYSPALASSGSGLGTGTVTITNASGTQTTFATGSGVNSLSSLASAINASSAGVSASVIHDASGTRLALVSSNSGASADFSVSYGASNATTWSSASVASASTGLAAGSFQVGDGSSTATIQVNAGDTLSTVAANVNSQGLGVTASVVSDSSGYHLQIVPQVGDSVSVAGDPAFSFQRASTAVNASLTVDGVPISSASNTVTGALPGITLSLTGTTTTGNPASLQVAADTDTITQSLSTFVSDYNSALSQVNAQFNFNSATTSQGVLGGDTNIRSLQNTLLSITGYNVGLSASGSSSGNSTVGSLADLGISVGDDGSLSLDSSKLTSALANPSAVQSFFQGSALNGFAQSLNSQLSSYNNANSGSIAGEIANLNQQYTSLGTEVTDYESGYVASQRTLLTAMYSKAEIALQQLPTQLKQIQAELGNNGSSGN
jgi:flagellar hook-associated protein 2